MVKTNTAKRTVVVPQQKELNKNNMAVVDGFNIHTATGSTCTLPKESGLMGGRNEPVPLLF